MDRRDLEATIASISASLSPSAEVNIQALAVSLAQQIVEATNNNVEAAFKFLDLAKVVNKVINDTAQIA